MTSAQFVELVQLCPDHNEVGAHLLSMAKSLSASQPPTTQSMYMYIHLHCIICMCTVLCGGIILLYCVHLCLYTLAELV